jgi:hypothetical protein
VRWREASRETSVVDQDIDVGEVGGQRRHRLLDGGPVMYVEPERQDVVT